MYSSEETRRSIRWIKICFVPFKVWTEIRSRHSTELYTSAATASSTADGWAHWFHKANKSFFFFSFTIGVFRRKPEWWIRPAIGAGAVWLFWIEFFGGDSTATAFYSNWFFCHFRYCLNRTHFTTWLVNQWKTGKKHSDPSRIYLRMAGDNRQGKQTTVVPDVASWTEEDQLSLSRCITRK